MTRCTRGKFGRIVSLKIVIPTQTMSAGNPQHTQWTLPRNAKPTKASLGTLTGNELGCLVFAENGRGARRRCLLAPRRVGDGGCAWSLGEAIAHFHLPGGGYYSQVFEIVPPL